MKTKIVYNPVHADELQLLVDGVEGSDLSGFTETYIPFGAADGSLTENSDITTNKFDISDIESKWTKLTTCKSNTSSSSIAWISIQENIVPSIIEAGNLDFGKYYVKFTSGASNGEIRLLNWAGDGTGAGGKDEIRWSSYELLNISAGDDIEVYGTFPAMINSFAIETDYMQFNRYITAPTIIATDRFVQTGTSQNSFNGKVAIGTTQSQGQSLLIQNQYYGTNHSSIFSREYFYGDSETLTKYDMIYADAYGYLFTNSTIADLTAFRYSHSFYGSTTTTITNHSAFWADFKTGDWYDGITNTNLYGLRITGIDGFRNTTNRYGVSVESDTTGLWMGIGKDAHIYYDGTDLVVNPQEVGTGSFKVNSTAHSPEVMEIVNDVTNMSSGVTSFMMLLEQDIDGTGTSDNIFGFRFDQDLSYTYDTSGGNLDANFYSFWFSPDYQRTFSGTGTVEVDHQAMRASLSVRDTYTATGGTLTSDNRGFYYDVYNRNTLNSAGKVLTNNNYGARVLVRSATTETAGDIDNNSYVFYGELQSLASDQQKDYVGTGLYLSSTFDSAGISGTSKVYGIHYVTDEDADTEYFIYNPNVVDSLMANDNGKLLFGTGEDASIYYDGSDLIINTQEVGSGNLLIPNGLIGINTPSPTEILEITDTGVTNTIEINKTPSTAPSRPTYSALDFNHTLNGITASGTSGWDYSGFYNKSTHGTTLDLSNNNVLVMSHRGIRNFERIQYLLTGTTGVTTANISQYGIDNAVTNNVDNQTANSSNYFGYGIYNNLTLSNKVSGGGSIANTIYGSRNRMLNFTTDVTSGTSTQTIYGSSTEITEGSGNDAGMVTVYGDYYDIVSSRAATPATMYAIYNASVDTAVKNLLGKDDVKTFFGTGEDASIYYDGTDLIINPKEVGTGILDIQSDVEVDDLDVTGIQKYENAFTFTLDASASTDVVTFPTAFAGGVTPVVICTPPYQTSFWITSITNTGFTFNVGTTNAYAQTINCIVMETS